ncbi:ATP-binding protein [Listeria sp. PSOL-1]|uniref:ATP-binding protein n=1 Tax=Listeria sp. PSOL-1 TaxID=1844999 RepID=UPI0013D6ABCB|nr:ATP-binding protein [Listeria sp. PSOL-1]
MKLWNSIVGKIWSTIILLLIGVMVICGFLVAMVYEKNNFSEIEKELEHTASGIISIMEAKNQVMKNQESGSEALNLLNKTTGVIVAQNQKSVYYNPSPDKISRSTIDKLTSDAKIQKALQSAEKLTMKYDFKDNRHELPVELTVKPFKLTNGETGVVYVYKSYIDILNVNKKTTRTLLIAGIGAILVTSLLSFIFSSRMAFPLREMKKIAVAVSRGNFDNRVPSYTHDEIGDLGIAFNNMAQQLKYNITALQQEKEQLSNILVGMADGVIKFNIDKTIILSNPPAEEFLHNWFFSNENIERVLIPEKLNTMLDAISKTQDEQVGEITFGDQTYVTILTLLYNGENVRSIVAVIRDVTEEKRLEKMKSDFVSNISHELRTPISMLQGYSEAIIDGIAQNEEEVREFAQIIYEESLRIGRLVNDMLDLARMEAGFNHLDKKEQKVVPFIKKVVSNFGVLARENFVELKIDARDPDLVYQFDTDRLEQVLINLIMNAIRHTGRSGYHGVVTVKESVDEVNEQLLIVVQDNGVGIPEQDIPYLFERFYKADKARTRSKAGTGIGLAIVKNIVEAHNGKITIESELGKGSSFIISLPLSTKE